MTIPIEFKVPRSLSGQVFQNHGKAWTEEHKSVLKEMFDDGKSCLSMSLRLGRRPDAVAAKLEDLRRLHRSLDPSYGGVYEVSELHFKLRGLPNPYRVAQTDGDSVDDPKPQPQPQPESTTMNAPAIETRTFIDGTDASSLSDEAIFLKIAKAEEQVAKYEKIVTKPKKLQAKIDAMKKAIQELADYVDSRPSEV